MKNEKAYLLHIVEANDRLHSYLAKDYDDYFVNEMMQDAVVKVLSNIAESSTHIEEETKNEYPQLPWQKIRGFRNILVHEYLGDLSHRLLWDVVHDELPVLVAVAREILQKKYNLKSE